MNNKLPEGFTVRPATLDDAEATVEMLNAASVALIGVEAHLTEDQIGEWSEPGFNLERDSRLVFDPGGRLVGYYEFWDPAAPHVHLYTWGQVHPDYTDLGIGSYLLDWVEARAHESIELAPDEARVTLGAYILTQHAKALTLFGERGYQPVRYSLRMVIDLPNAPEPPVWPAGIRVAPMVVGRDDIAVATAVRESFRDHWGFVERPFEVELEQYRHLMETDPRFDPTLWFLAWDGDQVAGISLCYPWWWDDREMGWVGTLGVLRPWRRKGLGLALLQYSFQELYRIGRRKVGLGVDAQNLTGALRLYERAGMRSDPNRKYVLYQKELRSGVEIGTETVESEAASA